MRQSFGVKLPGTVPRWAATYHDVPNLVVEFERLGFDDVVDGEHILFSPVMRHPGGAGNMVHGRDSQRSDRGDTIVTFAAAAAKTRTIGFVSSVLLPAAHGFAVLARHARAEDVIRACLQLWQPGLSSYHGRWIDFADVISEPAPFTAGGPPVWWGGNALKGRTARRVAEFCAGWLSREAADYDEIARSIESIRDQCAALGRDPETVSYRCSLTPTGWPAPEIEDELVDAAVAGATRLAGLGVTNFTVPLNYYQIELDGLGRLLKALRAA
jgi:alkanesulfonate monooxygenase SsuD/methylene tetrahydromethanopterin reductase-like flavin-dependent oxidoreductase (luciferase family)